MTNIRRSIHLPEANTATVQNSPSKEIPLFLSTCLIADKPLAYFMGSSLGPYIFWNDPPFSNSVGHLLQWIWFLGRTLIMVIGEKVVTSIFFHFTNSIFYPLQKKKKLFNLHVKFIFLLCGNAFGVDQTKILLFIRLIYLYMVLPVLSLTHSQTSPSLDIPALQVFWEHCSKKSFHSDFNPFLELYALFIKFKKVICKLVQFGRV